MTGAAETGLQAVITAAGVEKIIWLDDLFDPALDVTIELADLIGQLHARGLSPVHAALTELSPGVGLDDWTDRIEQAVEAGQVTVDELVQSVREQLGLMVSTEGEFTDSALQEVLNSFGESLTKLGSADQARLGTDLATDATPTLVIIDREFKIDGETVMLGDQVLQRLASSGPSSLTLVMLTRSRQPTEVEELRQELAKDLEIEIHRFAVMSKALPSEGDGGAAASATLMQSFQVVFTHRTCFELIEKLADVMDKELKNASADLVGQSVYDLDRIVFENSLQEGASELDVLTRILLLRQRVAADALLGANDEYFRALGKLRALREASGPLPTGHRIRNGSLLSDWRRDELFDSGDRINPSHSPLSCGDVFKTPSSNHVFVLLAQPCDITVRSNGSRKVDEGVLVKATEIAADGDLGGTNQRFFIAPSATSGKFWKLDFNVFASVDLRVLDFVVFNSNGAARCGKGFDAPMFLLPGWKKRLAKIKTKLDKSPQAYDRLTLSDCISYSKGSFVDGVMSYQYVRQGRIRQPLSLAAYAAFASYHARAAFDHNFAKNLDSPPPVETAEDESAKEK